MKPLNRPMFRYGGPIKEGVMSGIREPKKNGGSMMANDEGPRRAALVGNPIYPKGPDGRTNHVLPLIIGQGLRMAARPFGKFVMRQMAGPVKKNLPIKNLNLNLKGTPIKGGLQAERFDPNRLGQAFINDPLAKSVMTGSSFVGRGIKAGGKGIYNVGKYATTTPSGLTFLGAPVAYQAGKYFLSSGEEIKDPNDIKKIKQGGRQFTGDEAMVGDPRKPLPDSKPTLSKEDLRKKNVERYRDIMDIKGMNKDAAYNSLIAASQAINESGDFKGDIKSGKLINQIIQATSKQFDKPKQTKDAIDTLILKGEIEKDIKASDPSNEIANRLREVQIKKGLRELNPSFDNLKAAFAKDNKGQSGIDLAAGAYSQNTGETFRGPLISKADFKDILSNLKKDPKTQDVDEVSIIKTWTQGQLDSSQKNIPDGNYTVGDKIVTIKDKIVVDVN